MQSTDRTDSLNCAPVQALSHILQAFRHCWVTNPALSLLILFSLGSLALSTLGLAFDHRHINGELAWIKPCKFSISLSLYGASLIWLTRFLPARRPLLRLSSAGALVGSVVELSAITTQVLRGTTSHFNTATPLDAALFYAIELAIIPVALAILLVFGLLLAQKDLPPVMGLALRWGAFLTVIGLIPGVLMLLPDPVQDFITANKQFDGHTIGFGEGGPGLPWLGWSTVAGDLRVAHFVGLHALQVLPLLGYAVIRFACSLSAARQKALISIAGLTYLGLELLLICQALHAESIISPGKQTLIVSSILYCPAIFAVLWVLRGKQPAPFAGAYQAAVEVAESQPRQYITASQPGYIDKGAA